MQRGFGAAQRGAVLPLVAICLAVLLGFAGMGVDVGFLEYQQQAQQSATDAAAMGGAEASYADGCQSSSSAQSAAKADATLNGYTAGTTGSYTTQVAVNSPPTTGYYASNPCAVAVTITQPKQTFFSRIFGFMSMAESTTAVGVASQNNPGCIWLLNSTTQTDMSNAHISTPGCNIYINDNANMSNSSINAAYIGYANGTNNISGATFANATPAPMSAVADPCPQMPGCAYLTSNPPAASSGGFSSSGGCVTGSFSGGSTIGSTTPGASTCFSSLTVTGTNVVCGLIQITGMQMHLQGSTITTCSTGATLALSSTTSDVNVSNANLTITAPTSGNTRGVAIWRTSTQGNSVNFSGCTCAITGLMYFPTSQVNYSTAADAYTVMVFGQANFSNSNGAGSTGLILASPPPNGTVALKATLAQ